MTDNILEIPESQFDTSWSAEKLNSQVNSQSTSLQLPSQAEQKGKSDLNLVSAAICIYNV